MNKIEAMGIGRSLEPANSVLQPAWKVDNDMALRPGEILIAVKIININLTSFNEIGDETEFDEVLQKHFVDSVLKSEIFIKEDTKTLIDVGTGAGFPGVPLKIMYPQLKVTLLDSLNKRLNFLNQVIEKLGLENITTVHYRAEDGARKAELREQFDCVVSRAVANMSTLCEYCLPYAKVGGCFVAYKSDNAEEEIDKAKKAVHLLGGVKENAIYFDLPDSDIGRSLVIVKKKEPTSKKYPRKAGLPSKEPLQ